MTKSIVRAPSRVLSASARPFLQTVPPEPAAYCPAWHARGLWSATGGVHGARCCWCNRDIAAPDELRGFTLACVYCGLDRGELPAVEIEPEWIGTTA